MQITQVVTCYSNRCTSSQFLFAFQLKSKNKCATENVLTLTVNT